MCFIITLTIVNSIRVHAHGTIGIYMTKITITHYIQALDNLFSDTFGSWAREHGSYAPKPHGLPGG